ncbi:hypothetical protein LTSEINV_5248 [Salmonella enterica subsp. enterica serovar Inverness str. R8-3668]|uniref:Uncharacterized protein n=7 Tax=Salmonella enterica I TaxID=59201 RepID=A0A6C8GGV6_SALET|nr:hypothetical protein LTSEADE_5027 [Salmonella enterica subsp. enterica serovar Adelaide str. A4-669]EHC30995.1 hypothetical protein SeGA_4876 [Salmonella enterica subsp. enterica serovar Gaminara str. A4-567]EHC44397.1 hypothetical protein LTSEGIV_4838 [Salmonella enterica subsp. enterica serovar Give str. S5-487]EHC50678.1 hypothetical protein LTSEINV_5248 [Salmonella enterica subsp. enterica serovar Inverness str. R8-3668]EHC58373.1 hypothetical protein LTSEJOH_5168 [Salmonella enterica su
MRCGCLVVNNIKTSVHYFFEQVRIFDKFRGLFLFCQGPRVKFSA